MATQFGASGLLAVNKPLFMKSTSLVYAVKSGLQLAHSEEHGSPIHFKKIKCGDQKHPTPHTPHNVPAFPFLVCVSLVTGSCVPPLLGWFQFVFLTAFNRACVRAFVRSSVPAPF